MTKCAASETEGRRLSIRMDTDFKFLPERGNQRRDSLVSESFINLVHDHQKSYCKDYDIFATSYWCPNVPWPRLFCGALESDTCGDIQIPFANPTPFKELIIQENLRKDLGPSVRKEKLKPNPKFILGQILSTTFPSREDRTAFLYMKAREWCEMNKALALDEKYPKPDRNIVRKSFSDLHRGIIEELKHVGEEDDSAAAVPVMHKESVDIGKMEGVHTNGISEKTTSSTHKSGDSKSKSKGSRRGSRNKNSLTITESSASTNHEQDIVEDFPNASDECVDKIGDIFSSIKVPEKMLEESGIPWQFEAQKSLTTVPKPKKIRYWKKNIYPPKSREDVIAERRARLKPLPPVHQQIDRLSGIWDPELMTDEFHISPKDYDSRLETKPGPEAIDWWTVHNAREKCWNWLKSIPDTL